MRNIEATIGGSSESAGNDSFVASRNESQFQIRGVVPSQRASVETHTQLPIVPSRTVDTTHTQPPITPSFTRTGRARVQEVVSAATPPDDHRPSSSQSADGARTGDNTRNETKRDDQSGTEILPPTEPPSDRPEGSAELPDPQHPWERIKELAQIPPKKKEREQVHDRYTMGVLGLLERHREFVDTDTLPDGLTENYICLVRPDSTNSVNIYVGTSTSVDGQKLFLNLDFPFTADAEVKDEHLSYVQDSNGIVHKHVISKKVIRENRQKILPGAMPYSAVVEASHTAESRLLPNIRLEKELGFTDEVGLEELTYVMGLADNVIALPKDADTINDIYTGRLNGHVVGTEDAQHGAREFTTYVTDYLRRHGENPDNGHGLEFEIPGPHEEWLKVQAGFYEDTGEPYTSMNYFDPVNNNAIMLIYHVADAALLTSRVVRYIDERGDIVETKTAVTGDAIEARSIRNFLNFPLTRFGPEFWKI